MRLEHGKRQGACNRGVVKVVVVNLVVWGSNSITREMNNNSCLQKKRIKARKSKGKRAIYPVRGALVHVLLFPALLRKSKAARWKRRDDRKGNGRCGYVWVFRRETKGNSRDQRQKPRGTFLSFPIPKWSNVGILWVPRGFRLIRGV